ncbi:hypothetical protein GNI_075780 [Gregarina niphandrodes]|uniref:Transmembrane protein n=1 Tax=Gregarina niphandrodes TaxID=110365 RepID=A0A023B6X3_GRENI|nr:hypothetical protein GNI_075780 [Gregarina niphandrodes]EZG66784.1 hypothetical protein GNI_075780 [Gregarina niphandrodes]|eukprot:XP_011130485.1 hypothetical protein GNI_075780 [Gregarina niphandrodes]
MKFARVATVVAIAAADIIADCRTSISSTNDAWIPTCQTWCDQYGPNGYLADQCQSATDGNELISCILKFQTYCINSDQPSSNPSDEDQLVKDCQASITSQNAGWIPNCQDYCKDFIPGRGRAACTKPITDGLSMASCVGEIYHYCVLKTE